MVSLGSAGKFVFITEVSCGSVYLYSEEEHLVVGYRISEESRCR